MTSNGLTLDDYLPYRLSVASNAVSALIAGTYEHRFGLRIPEWRLIAVLAEDGPSTQQALVKRTGMDKVTISRAAQALNKRKLISRAPHENDGRSHRIALTEAGQALHADVAPAAIRIETAVMSNLTGDEVSLLKTLLRRVEKAAHGVDLEAAWG
ncbi:MAG: MarR family winged helix-turn-helix transcriptional regulator [Asticcacaulis sp.]